MRITLVVAASLLAVGCLAEVVSLDANNVDQVLKDNELVFVNFYADWCRFSQQLKPIYSQASDNFQTQPKGKVVWASVDADKQPGIATKYHVNKYPTLKLFRNGELTKKEYRSQRSVDALIAFVNKQLESGLMTIESAADLQQKIKTDKRNVIAYFPDTTGPAHDNFKKIANILREECGFYFGTGPAFSGEFAQGPKVVFRDANSNSDLQFTGDLANYEFFKAWVVDKCIPLVREITFENAEELTEEGLPFLILFRNQDDSQSQQVFTDAVLRELPDTKSTVNCLVADGQKFAHPLHHLGKSVGDLPVVAIDSFRHMYLFPNYNDLNVPGKLRQFVEDLHSGKLHREFHHGPDPTQGQANGGVPQTSPPESVFEKLKPSHQRYTVLDKTEL